MSPIRPQSTEQNDEWAISRRYMGVESMAALRQDQPTPALESEAA